MFLDSDHWRVRHWLRRPSPAGSQPPRAPPRPGFVGRAEDAALVLDGRPYQMAGINYYPQATPGTLLADYDGGLIDRDLDRIRSLGLNTIRIFVPFEQFGGPQPDPAMVERLGDLLDRAGAHDQRVIVTLFDFWTGYDLLRWPDGDRQLEVLLDRYQSHPAILAWDLKNEPDLDYKSAGRDTVDGWLAHVARLARQHDPNHLLTIAGRRRRPPRRWPIRSTW